MRVVLTRSEERGAEFASALREAGHEVACAPLTRIEDGEPFPDPAGFDGVLFASVAAVERAPAEAEWPRVGAVGPVTAAALEARGIRVEVVGAAGGEELARLWGPAPGDRLLLPQAAEAHAALDAGLRAAGAEVTRVAVYRTVVDPGADRVPFEAADVICFFAPSQVDAFSRLGIATNARLWGHGPTTSAALEGLEGHVDALEDLL